MCEKAIQLGLRELAITYHADFLTHGVFEDEIDLEKRQTAMQTAQQKYAGQLVIRNGIELGQPQACLLYTSIKIQSEESNRVTLTRGESMGTKNDGRGWYNPAMIEVTVPAGTSSASLTLENIILDDAGKKCGEYFAQPSTDWSGKTMLSYKEQGINKEIEVPNTNIVQDAIDVYKRQYLQRIHRSGCLCSEPDASRYVWCLSSYHCTGQRRCTLRS